MSARHLWRFEKPLDATRFCARCGEVRARAFARGGVCTRWLPLPEVEHALQRNGPHCTGCRAPLEINPWSFVPVLAGIQRGSMAPRIALLCQGRCWRLWKSLRPPVLARLRERLLSITTPTP
ncbi:MAG: hypothetical protein EYC70_00325 [Planctomycetota bacterium]|nr:MAG: hypothetical protein EYC70_00325 [Planctomycetota bacterium]